MKNIAHLFIVLFLFMATRLVGQLETYGFQKSIEEPTDLWHSIKLPNEVFGQVNPNFNDIRIYGIKEGRDTIEAPFIIDVSKEIPFFKGVDCDVINVSHTDKAHFFTFRIDSKETISYINLDFRNKNFDWKVKLQGSQNQSKWFTVLDNYRILSIDNSQTNYSFTDLDFPPSAYKYYRLQIIHSDKPLLRRVNITQDDSKPAVYNSYSTNKVVTKEDKKLKKTVVEISLNQKVPVSYLGLTVNENYDYYRPITIKYVKDSTKTPKGTWVYNYQTAYRGTLSSLEESIFRFETVMTNKLKIELTNHDNTPLSLSAIKAKGYEHQLVARFTEKANYFLVYGKENAIKPRYDIQNSVIEIPDSLGSLTLGLTQEIEKPLVEVTQPMFENPAWLWVVLGLIVLLLGWFAMRMMKAK